MAKETKESIESLRRQVEALEKKQQQEQERKALEKKVKALKFRESTLGKVAGGISKVGEAITRPAKKTKEGKPIPGTGGVGARVIGAFSRLGQKQPPKPMPIRKVPLQQPQPQTMETSPMERAFVTPKPPVAQMDFGFGMSSQPSAQPMYPASQPQRTFNIGEQLANIDRQVGGLAGFDTPKARPMPREKVMKKMKGKKRVPAKKMQPQQKAFDINDVLRGLPQ
jgi:hypothetical protein